jgi:gliding motility-associated-like protein
MRCIRFYFFVIIQALFIDTIAQTDDIGSGRGLQMNGSVDYIDLGNIYDELQLPITVSAWVYVDQAVSNWAPVFASQDNAPIYNGFWLIVQPTSMSIGYGDGFGENNPAFRRSKTANFANISNRWVHITGIIRGAVDMDLLINGINVGGDYSGFTDKPMSASASDIAKIGYWYSNNQTLHFKGKIDEVRMWNRALSAEDVRNVMCKRLVGNESGLIGYWGFDELGGGVVNDKSPSGHHGTLQGNPVRVFSGAPIGDKSINDYKSNWSNLSIEMNEGFERIIVSKLQGNPEGIHIYEVASQPSQTNGLDLSLFSKPYFGVFLASLDNNNKYEVVLLDQEGILCSANSRFDNSTLSWLQVGLPALDQSQRGEYLKIPGAVIGLDLGPDASLCDKNDFIIDTKIADPTVSFLWSTGSIESKISVTQSGKYWVRITGSCGVSRDTVAILFNQSPPDFSLGDDQTICPFKPTMLKPYSSSSNYEFQWQDGSKNDSYQVTDFGEYWVKAKNACGEVSDTILFETSFYELDSIPNVITPNGDLLNDFFVLNKTPIDNISLLVLNRWGKEVFFSSNYNNDWNGEGLSAGVYFYTVIGSCIKEAKGSVSIIR